MRVAVCGVGHSKFGRRRCTVQELAFEAFREALLDCDVSREELEVLLIGSSPEYHRQRSLSGVVAEYLGLNPKPTFLTEAACASGSAALFTAFSLIRSGFLDIACVLGVQKMTELSTPEILALMGRVGDVMWEANYGTTFPGYYALYAQRHMHDYGTTKEQLAKVSVKNHKNGVKNPKAMFQKEITLEKALSSPMIAYPLQLYDCCANADGASCLIIASEDKARKLTDTSVFLESVGVASSEFSILKREDLTSIPSAKIASRDAFKKARLTPKEVDVSEVHDCFTIAEIIAYEDLGFCEKGKGGKLIEEGQTYVGGEVPVNPSGGLKAKGHPVGATGISMAYEIVKQLRGESLNQVEGAEVGLTHNVGGIGQYCFVFIYRR